MTNRFYGAFDTDLETGKEREPTYRSPFEQDRDRIIHTAAFRRLQSKTQLFLSGEYDFYRTRLTHSLEVSQIGRSICRFLLHTDDHLGDDFYIDPDLVEATCLAHDLGHPPFGHMGERTLNELMRDHGGFEGNAQTLRLLTERIYQDPDGRRGMHPTRAFLDGVLKYKTLYGELDHPPNHFIYDDQEEHRRFALGGRSFPDEAAPGEDYDAFKSIECQIMDWADDTAYSINDLVDGIAAQFVTVGHVERWKDETADLDDEGERVVDEVLDALRRGTVERTFALKIGSFIQACRLGPTENFMSDLTNRYSYRLVTDPAVEREQKVLKRMARELLFNKPQLNQLEYKGDVMLRRLFTTLLDHYLSPRSRAALVADRVHDALLREEDEGAKRRMLCDYVADMTDAAAVHHYRRLFEPTYGSLIEIV